MHAAVLALTAMLATGASVPAAPSHFVEDQAGFLSEQTRVALDAKLHRYEQATGHQVIVWIGTTLDGADLADWSARTFAAWKVGRAGHDDGIAMFVFAQDHQIDIEVGYGLEGQVPDATASRIIRETMVPMIRAGDRDGAITAGANAVLTAIEGAPWQDSAAGTTSAGTQQPARQTWTDWLVMAAIAIGVLFAFRRHPWLALYLLNSGSHGSGGGFRGGFRGRFDDDGGGGGGGFFGGGGHSGGGGARGGW